jgi:hypothetical protein
MRTGCFIVAEMRRGGGVGANEDDKKGLLQFNPTTSLVFEFGSDSIRALYIARTYIVLRHFFKDCNVVLRMLFL